MCMYVYMYVTLRITQHTTYRQSNVYILHTYILYVYKCHGAGATLFSTHPLRFVSAAMVPEAPIGHPNSLQDCSGELHLSTWRLMELSLCRFWTLGRASSEMISLDPWEWST